MPTRSRRTNAPGKHFDHKDVMPIDLMQRGFFNTNILTCRFNAKGGFFNTNILTWPTINKFGELINSPNFFFFQYQQ